MKTITSRSTGLVHSNRGPRRPSVLTLLGHILKSVFTGEALWIAAPGGALLAYLHANQVAADNLLVLLIGAIAILAFLRGCKEWQKDRDLYRKTLSYKLRARNPD